MLELVKAGGGKKYAAGAGEATEGKEGQKTGEISTGSRKEYQDLSGKGKQRRRQEYSSSLLMIGGARHDRTDAGKGEQNKT